MTLFPEKISILTPKISDDLFFSHRPGFSDFTFLYSIKCRIRPFLHQKNHYFGKEFLDRTIFFTLFVLSRASDNTTSLNIGGSMHGPSPHLKFWGAVHPSPPRSPPLQDPKFFFSRGLNTNDSSLILTTSGQHGKQWKPWWTNFILTSWNLPRNI